MDATEDPSIADIAKQLGLVGTTGEPQKSKVHKILQNLEKAKLVTKGRDGKYALTPQGKGEALKMAVVQGRERINPSTSDLN